VEERWKKFEELAFAFGVELKPAEGVEFYSGGPLPDSAELIRFSNLFLRFWGSWA